MQTQYLQLLFNWECYATWAILSPCQRPGHELCAWPSVRRPTSARTDPGWLPSALTDPGTQLLPLALPAGSWCSPVPLYAGTFKAVFFLPRTCLFQWAQVTAGLPSLPCHHLCLQSGFCCQQSAVNFWPAEPELRYWTRWPQTKANN